MAFTYYMKARVLQMGFTDRTFYVALFNGDPEDTGTEVSGGGYARQQITFGTPTDDGNGNAQISNINEIEFPTATADWGEVTHVGIFDDDSTGANLCDVHELSQSRTILAGDPVKIEKNGYIIKQSSEDN